MWRAERGREGAHTRGENLAEGPRGGTEAALIPQRCRAARQSGSRRQGTLAAAGAAAARRLPQHGESSSTRVWTEAMEVPTTPTPNGHHLPPIPDTGPSGPALSGRTSPPFPRRASATGSDPHGPPPGNRRCVQLVRGLPPRVGSRPAGGGTARRGHTANGTRGRPTAGTGGGVTNPSTTPLQAGRDDAGPGRGHWAPDHLGTYTTGFPISAATQPSRPGAEDAPRQREHDAGAPGQDEEMTETSGPQKSGASPPTAAFCSMSQQRVPSTGKVHEGHLGTTPGTPPRLAPHWTRTGGPCLPQAPDHHNGGTRTPLTTRN